CRSPAAWIRTRTWRSTRPAACCSASPRTSWPRPARAPPPPGPERRRPAHAPGRNTAGPATTARIPHARHRHPAPRAARPPPARVYQAFLDPAALVKWLPPHGFMATVHECDVREGGRLPDVLHPLRDRRQPPLLRALRGAV